MSVRLILIVFGTVLAGLSGVPGVFMDRRSPAGQRLAAGLMTVAAVLGLCGAILALLPAAASEPAVDLPVAILGERLSVAVDGLGAFFLIPIFLMGGLGSLYGLGYWPQTRHLSNGRKLRVFWGVAVAGMALQVLARHAFVFLIGWEFMAIAAFFMITTEEHVAESREAGLVYLMATHFGMLAVFAMFALFHAVTGSFLMRPLAVSEASLGMLSAIFLAALLAFGLKAGIMPLHFWLPSAHGNAPSHVSALMSGVLIKMGIYGLIRFLGFLPDPPASWGILLLLLGMVSSVLGVVFAIGQHDLKRLLAYHSVENIGIIVMGLGLALAGRALDRPVWVVLGLAGALLHVWNHCLFKGLLFLGAGAVVHATHTRLLDRLGGLAKPMPRTALLFFIGAAAICGLPPLNGFISELLIYLGLLRTVTDPHTGRAAGMAELAVPALALTGALALACFVKVYGTVFLGTARSSRAEHAQEAPKTMTGAMAVLAAACLAIGLFPVLILFPLEQAMTPWLPAGSRPQLAEVAPLLPLTIVGISLTVVSLLLYGYLSGRLRGVARPSTWGCGYAAGTARIQYTASSFAQLLTQLFNWVLRPHGQTPDLPELFPAGKRFVRHVDEIVLDRWLLPAARAVERGFSRFHLIQRGVVQIYLLYVLLAVLALLAWIVPFGDLLQWMWSR